MIKVETMHPQEGEVSASFSSSSSSHRNHNQVSPSPSFSSYSSETLAEIAARVIEELRRDPHSISDEDGLFQPYQNDDDITQNDSEENSSEFEFALVSNTSPVSADDIFYNGQIKPMYPIFDRSLLLNEAVTDVPNENHDQPRRRRLPLRKLMFEEGETASCSSSTDENADLDCLAPEGSYCVWTPNSVGTERKKSNSTGSVSKRWKLRNLMLRSHSDGKEKQPVMLQIPATAKHGAAVEHDGKNRTTEQGKRKSFLPYKPELVGLFANVNGLGRNLNPF